MSIGIIGAGALGSNVARLLARSGIPATIANSRGPQSLAGLVGELGPSIKAGAVEEAGRPQPVLDGHRDHALGGEARGVIEGGGGAGGKGATVDVHHHRQPRIRVQRRRPYVQQQAIVTLRFL